MNVFVVRGSYLDKNNLTEFPSAINEMPLLTNLYVNSCMLLPGIEFATDDLRTDRDLGYNQLTTIDESISSESITSMCVARQSSPRYTCQELTVFAGLLR